MSITENGQGGSAGAAAGLPDLPGFDMAGALQRLGGNQKLYRTLLERFYNGYNNKFSQDIQAGLAAGNLEETQRNAHTVKGLAGTIGHAGLAEASLGLEMACKNALQGSGSSSELEPALARFLAQLEAVINALSTIFGPAPA